MFAGISYYRLKQTDKNGTDTYSDIAAVNNEIENVIFTIFPNPSDGKVNVTVSGMEGKTTSISITEMSGKEIYLTEKTISNNNETIIIDAENKIAEGTYLMRLVANNKEYDRKIIIIK